MRKHSLVEIICLSIDAVIAGAEGQEDIEELRREKADKRGGICGWRTASVARFGSRAARSY